MKTHVWTTLGLALILSVSLTACATARSTAPSARMTSAPAASAPSATARQIVPAVSFQEALAVLQQWLGRAQVAPNVTLAVMDFNYVNPTQATAGQVFGRTLATQLSAGIPRLNKFNLVDRSSLESLLEERQFSQVGELTDERLRNLAAFIPARYVLTGHFSSLSSKITVAAKLLEVSSSQVIAAETVDIYYDADTRALLNRPASSAPTTSAPTAQAPASTPVAVTPTPTPAAPSAPPRRVNFSHWNYERRADPMTDVVEHEFSTKTVDLERTDRRIGIRYIKHPTPSLSKVTFFATIGERTYSMGNSETRNWAYRVDSNPAVNETWTYLAGPNQDYYRRYSPNPNQAARQILNGEILTIRYADGVFNTFNIQFLREFIESKGVTIEEILRPNVDRNNF